MPTLNITQTYATGNVLNKVDLDNICTSLTTFVNSTKLDSSNVQTGGLIGANLANATVTATQLAASVAGSGLTGGAGTALAVNVDNSTLAVVGNQVVVKTGGITSTQIGAGAITRSSLPAVGQQISSSCGTFSTSGGSYTQVTNLTVTITTTGRPVQIMFISDQTNNLSSIAANNTATNAFANANFAIDRDTGTIVYRTALTTGGAAGVNFASVSAPPGSLNCVDIVAAGTHTYKLLAFGASGNAQCSYITMVAFEL